MNGKMTSRKGLDRKTATGGLAGKANHTTLKINKLTNKRIQNEQENHKTRSN